MPTLVIFHIFRYNNKNNKVMYSLKCNYYKKEFNSINELVKDVINSGMDPNYEITRDGRGIGEEAWDFIVE